MTTLAARDVHLRVNNEEQAGLGKYTFCWVRSNMLSGIGDAVPNNQPYSVLPHYGRLVQTNDGTTYHIGASCRVDTLPTNATGNIRWHNFHSVNGYPGGGGAASPVAYDFQPPTNTIQTLRLSATAGTFTITVQKTVRSGAAYINSGAPQTTAAIAFNASAADIRAAVTALSNIQDEDTNITENGVEVALVRTGVYTLCFPPEFGSAGASSLLPVTIGTGSLTGTASVTLDWNHTFNLSGGGTWTGSGTDNFSGVKHQTFAYLLEAGITYDFTTKICMDATHATGLIANWANGNVWIAEKNTKTTYPGVVTNDGGKQYVDVWCGAYESVVVAQEYDFQYWHTIDRWGTSLAGMLAETPGYGTFYQQKPTPWGSIVVSGSGGIASSTTAATAFDVSMFKSPGGALSPPTNPTVPTVAGTTSSGNTLTATAGSCSGSPSPTATHNWQYTFDGGTTYTDLGVTAASIALTSTHVAFKLRDVVTWTNTAGTAVAQSARTSIITNSDGSFLTVDGEDGTTGGFSANINNETVSNDGTVSFAGTKSVKVVTGTAGTFRGAFWKANSGAVIDAGQQRRVTCQLKGTTGDTIRVAINTYGYDQNNNAIVVMSNNIVYPMSTGNWVSVDVPDPDVVPSNAAFQRVSITTGSTSQNVTFWIDALTLITFVPPEPPPPTGNRNQAGTRGGGTRAVGGTKRVAVGGWF